MTDLCRLGLFARGIKVLDLSAFLPGPLASLLLADMGAEILKIEPPSGDAMTQLGPRDAAGRPLFYEALNAGKSVRRMDLKQPETRAEFLRLVADFDVLIEGFRPGVMQRLGLNYPALREINPGLIYCSLSGYGAASPMAQRAGHDANYLAAAGVLHRNGADAPLFYDPPLSDVTGSLFGVIAILGALRARETDGQGCEIDIGLADVAMPLQLFQIAALWRDRGGAAAAADLSQWRCGLLPSVRHQGRAAYRARRCGAEILACLLRGRRAAGLDRARGRRAAADGADRRCRGADRRLHPGRVRGPVRCARLLREPGPRSRARRSPRPTIARAAWSARPRTAPCRRCFRRG